MSYAISVPIYWPSDCIAIIGPCINLRLARGLHIAISMPFHFETFDSEAFHSETYQTEMSHSEIFSTKRGKKCTT